jgi:uncharacterized protein YoxC
MEWAHVLVIILSVFLALFLLLAIILVAMLIRVTHQIKKVTDSAQLTVSHIEKVVAGITKVTTPLAMINMIKGFFNKAKKGDK